MVADALIEASRSERFEDEMIIAVFDPFSGAAGDMILGALIDAGAPIAAVQRELDKLNLPITLRTEAISSHAVNGLRLHVEAEDDAHSRTWRDIRGLIEGSALSDGVKSNALAVFARLAHAEAAAHQTTVDEVHFHEVGGLDAVADICGACIALELLGVERVYSGPLKTGWGFVRAAHGIMPVPAPATAELIRAANAPVTTALPPTDQPPGELLTPTGAAILIELAEFRPVEYAALALGHGFGLRELPWPNAVRVWIGDAASDEPEEPGILVMETNLDDLSPQHMELLTERLFAAGALDVWLTPIQMKKSRPATMVSALLPIARREELASVMIENSSTLGVRIYPVERTKADRRMETVATRWGDVRVKLRGWRGRVIDVNPEYDDCVAYARQADVPLREVWNEAHRYAESFIGRRLTAAGELA
jgi:uncharacterized protein (TIGR00299 family) protein